MTPEWGAPLAVGRSAEIHAWPEGGDLVVKLFPEGYPPALVDAEEAASGEAARLGLSTIACHGRVEVAGRAGLLLDRVHGESLTRQAERDPFRLRGCARALARAHVRVHESPTALFTEVREATAAALGTPPLAFLTGRQRALAAERVAALPAGDRVLHLDFHSENVFGHGGGHAVIDWRTTLRGDPAADVAMTVLLLRDAELWPGTPLLKRIAVQAVRRVVLSTYLAEYRRLTGMTDERVAAWRLPVVVLRMSTLDIASEREGFRRELAALLGAEE
ncbi:phosphotransferase family enzyme [Actinocorallia herbida]|uniref:Phosphotransferase family enzyme n=1 Tax=Actinocorallia herbida TaxID=58109 RepID=A0A3N1CUY7_9ACTN|nr:aminoglycoside phosphotransferase family protein [Actinocorallia herbida]ROO85111.1 phosphotransferase family enzyme [Actinocorallia herbida]